MQFYQIPFDSPSFISDNIWERTLSLILTECNSRLEMKDWFQKRSKEFIKTLFENCGYKFEEGVFEQLYQLALAHDKTGAVCVDTFNNILLKHQSPMKKIVDEVACIPEQIRKPPCPCVWICNAAGMNDHYFVYL